MGKRVFIIGMLALLVLALAAPAFAQVQVHGFLLARTIVTNNNYAARIDRYGLRLMQKVDDEFDLLTEVYIHPSETDARSRVYLESAFLNWHLKNRLPWDFNVRIGKGRNLCYGIAPSYASRRTSDYSLYSEAFTQMRVTGFQTFSNFGPVQLAVAVINPYSTSDGTIKSPLSRKLPDFPLGNNINIPICDRDNDTGAILNRIGVSGRLGYKTKILNVGASLYMSEILSDSLMYPSSVQSDSLKKAQKKAQTRFGLDAELKLDNGLLVQGQFTMAQTGVDLSTKPISAGSNTTVGLGDKWRETNLSHNGGEVLVGWEKPKCGLYARYGMVTYDDKLQGMNQIMLSGIYKIRPNIHLRLEGLINGEDTGEKKGWDKKQKWVEVKNNVLFFETCFEW